MTGSILNPWHLFSAIGASRGAVARVDFVSGDAIMHADLPSDQLWVAIKDVLVYEDYEFLDRFRLSRLPVNATVLDAGAFVGLYSLRASQHARRVVALEPSSRNFRYLTANLTLNHLRNVEPRQVALSSSAGIAPFSEAGTTSRLDKDGQVLVEVNTLDDVVESLGHVDLMKMDIEGAEYNVFASSRSALGSIEKIAAEVHVYSDADRSGLAGLLTTLGRGGFEVEVLWHPFQNLWYGMTKPWRCSLKRYNDGSATLYRILLSLLYGAGPVARFLKQSVEIGYEGVLYAHRK
jgi:FkbM family methyltransferase